MRAGLCPTVGRYYNMSLKSKYIVSRVVACSMNTRTIYGYDIKRKEVTTYEYNLLIFTFHLDNDGLLAIAIRDSAAINKEFKVRAGIVMNIKLRIELQLN